MKVDHIGIAVKNLKEVIEKFKKIYPDLYFYTEKSKDGKMEVEMVYDGDDILISYLINNAKNLLERKIDDEL